MTNQRKRVEKALQSIAEIEAAHNIDVLKAKYTKHKKYLDSRRRNNSDTVVNNSQFQAEFLLFMCNFQLQLLCSICHCYQCF